jgi:hypothetical protein
LSLLSSGKTYWGRKNIKPSHFKCAETCLGILSGRTIRGLVFSALSEATCEAIFSLQNGYVSNKREDNRVPILTRVERQDGMKCPWCSLMRCSLRCSFRSKNCNKWDAIVYCYCFWCSWVCCTYFRKLLKRKVWFMYSLII